MKERSYLVTTEKKEVLLFAGHVNKLTSHLHDQSFSANDHLQFILYPRMNIKNEDEKRTD